MMKITDALKLFFSFVFITALLSGCLISEVEQSATVQAGGEFTTKLTITDITADANAHVGAVCVLVPDDWEFVSGTYDSQVGTGSFIIDTNAVPVYGNIDLVLAPPAGMKWIKLLSDAAYTNEANVIHEANLILKAGQITGDFNIGYCTTKNSPDLLASLNTTDEDNSSAWADTSMNHKVTVTPAVGVEDESVVPTEYILEQNYPNPFNPSTVISFTLPEESNVVLSVYNSLGQQVATLINGFMSAGKKSVEFDASQLTSGISSKGGYASGIYFYKLEAGNFVSTKKMLLVK